MQNNFFDWLDAQTEYAHDITDPPMEAQDALNMLSDYLLGEDWCVALSESQKQVNTAIVNSILMKYSRKFRKQYRERI